MNEQEDYRLDPYVPPITRTVTTYFVHKGDLHSPMEFPEGETEINEPLKWISVCEICGEGKPVKTNSDSKVVCERCALGIIDPFVHTERRIGRNESCPCGSGIKFKKCCIKNSQDRSKQ